MHEPLPLFPSVSAAAVVLKLRSGQATEVFFRELGELCKAVEVRCGWLGVMGDGVGWRVIGFCGCAC